MRKKTKHKRNNNKMKVLIGVLLVLSIVAGWAVATINYNIDSLLNRMNRDLAIGLDKVGVDESNLSSDKKVINILLVGIDKREGENDKGRSDSCMIATLDMKNKKLKLTSLMRDMYLTIPGRSEDRFNAAYSYGGVSLLYQTIALHFGIKLDGYVVIDFDAFKKAVDKIGGVEITLTADETRYLTTAYKRGSVLELKEGLNNMNGAQALAYTRMRQDAKSDFGRTERQRKVLTSLFSKAKKLSFNELWSLCEDILPYLTSDLNNAKIKSYMTNVLTMGTTEIDQFRLPVNNSYTPKKVGSPLKDVLVIDIEANKKALNEFIFEYAGETLDK